MKKFVIMPNRSHRIFLKSKRFGQVAICILMLSVLVVPAVRFDLATQTNGIMFTSPAATTIMFEDFEDADLTNGGGTDPTGYVYNNVVGQAFVDEFSELGIENYWGRFDADTLTLPPVLNYTDTAPQVGTGFFTAQDTDSTLASGNVDVIVLDWTGIDVAAFTSGLTMSWYVAEDDDGINEDWDITTSFRLQYQIDSGGYINLFAIEGESATVGNRPPRVDTNFDGVGDGDEITDTFTLFTTGVGPIAALPTGTTLDIRLIIEDLDTSDEDIAFDNLLLQGTPVTAAAVNISGRVLTARGYGITNAFVSITDTSGDVDYARTNQFGYYHFSDIGAGQSYLIDVKSKRYLFTPRLINVAEDLNDVDFIAESSRNNKRFK